MVDLHTHILPGIDDGSSSPEETNQMLGVYDLHEFDHVVCTPHFDPAKEALIDFIHSRAEAMALFRDSKVTLIAGSETILHDYLFYYSDLSPLSIGNTKYILLELPYSKWGSEVYENINKLMRIYGLIPVIAHIERYETMKSRKKKMKKLIKLGCLLQLNASSLTDKKLKRRSLSYLKHGYIHVLASDCHNMSKRPPNLWDAYGIVQSKFGNSCYDRLKNNADDILAGTNLRESSVYIID